MTVKDYNSAKALIEKSDKTQSAIDRIKKIDPANIRLTDNYTSVRMAGIVDSDMIQMLKTMLITHLETKLAALEAEFEELGRVQNG